MEGGLDNALVHVLLDVLGDGHHTLAVDDGLDFINNISAHGLLDHGGLLDQAALVGGRGLLDVPLDVVHDALVDLAVHDGLHLHDAVAADLLVDHGCVHDGLGLLEAGGIGGEHGVVLLHGHSVVVGV